MEKYIHRIWWKSPNARSLYLKQEKRIYLDCLNY